jgi:molybdopterin-guanine dinucleotide biosynthesis protein A
MMTAIARQQITGLVLAGGLGRRMGGRDKGLLPYGDGLLVGQVIDALRPQVDTVLISANRNTGAYAEFGLPVLKDGLAGYQGPLAGFLAGLEAMRTDYLLTVPCDGPRVAGDLAQRLASGLANAPTAGLAVAHDGQRLQPVYALLHRRMLPVLREALAAGERSVQGWLGQVTHAVVGFADAATQFDNINTPDDYARWGPSGDRR